MTARTPHELLREARFHFDLAAAHARVGLAEVTVRDELPVLLETIEAELDG